MDFLNEIDQRCIYFLEIQTSFAVNNRLPITLSKEEEEEEDKTGKVIKPKSRFTVIANANGNMLVEGNLEIQIYYES